MEGGLTKNGSLALIRARLSAARASKEKIDAYVEELKAEQEELKRKLKSKTIDKNKSKGK